MVLRHFYDEFKEELSKVAIEISGTVKVPESELLYPGVSGKFKGKTVDIDLAWEVGAAFLRIHIISHFDFNLEIEKETTTSRVFEKLRMDVEVPLDRTVVPQGFDEKYQITGEPADKIKEFLSRKQTLQEIKLLEPFIRLTIKKTLIFSKHFIDEKEDFKAPRMMQIIRSLYELSELA